jgi:hypothetical protein
MMPPDIFQPAENMADQALIDSIGQGFWIANGLFSAFSKDLSPDTHQVLAFLGQEVIGATHEKFDVLASRMRTDP